MMRQECQKPQPGVNFRLMGLFMSLLGNLAAAYPESTGSSRQSETGQLCGLVAFMNREFHRKIDFTELLDKVPMSRSTLNRNFVRTTGETPMRYLLKLRLEHAASLLTHTDTSITEIAVASGFEDSNYFSRAFRKVYHLSPREFRTLRSRQA
ncbi:MAG: helix-turn-helix transcriptional regulator [Lentisphaeria bacterium]|nr:helix-turn-helix transcriptional regulator [Lentisphaeria bacterium]